MQCRGLTALQHVGSSQKRDWARVSSIIRWIPYHWATREAPQITFKLIFKTITENSLAVQWLGLCVSNRKGHGFSPSWGTKIPHAVRQGIKKKKDTGSDTKHEWLTCNHPLVQETKFWGPFPFQALTLISNYYSLLLLLYLFTWLCRVLVVACKLLVAACAAVGASSLTRDRTLAPCIGSSES